jgi:ribose-phosphate pyrophosphokinase
MKIFSGTSNRPLAEMICKQLNIELCELYLHTFPSGEKYCQYKTNIRGEDIFLIQSGSNPVNDNLMELLIMCDAARRASAKTITVVCPIFFYQRQERKDKPRVPISAKLVMDMIGCAGATRIVTLDLHAAQIQGFTNLPVDQLSFKPALVNALKNDKVDCVVAPDIGAVKRAEEYASAFNVDLVVISKKRKSDSDVELQHFIGDVKGRNVLIVDDMTESGGTLLQAAIACKKQKAKKVYCGITHGCFKRRPYDVLVDGDFANALVGWKTGKGRVAPYIDKLFVSNSIDFPKYSRMENKVIPVDMSYWFATAIRNITNNQSVTQLFQ